MVEYLAFNQGVVGSSPTGSTKFRPIPVMRVVHVRTRWSTVIVNGLREDHATRGHVTGYRNDRRW